MCWRALTRFAKFVDTENADVMSKRIGPGPPAVSNSAGPWRCTSVIGLVMVNCIVNIVISN